MPTPSAESNTDMEIDSNISMNVESNSDNVSDIIIMDTSDANLESYSSLPIDFESSNSSLETTESVDESLNVESSMPVFTDIAEETVYETEEFEDTIRCEERPEKECLESLVSDQQTENSLSDLIDSTGSESGTVIDVSDVNHKSNDENCVESELFINNDESIDVITSEESSISTADDVNKSFLVTSNLSDPSISEISNLITISKNTNLASGVLKKVAVNNIGPENNSVNIGVVPISISNSTFANSNVIQVNSIGNSKNISNLKPITIQNTRKLLPISIAPASTVKRTASISIGQPTSNFITKVIVGQSKGGQPIVFANAPKPKSICVVPTTNNTSSSAKPITAALAKQMGIKLQPIRPSTTKQLNKKFVLSSIPPGTQVLKKIQPISKSSTPTKILPAPLVSKSSVPGQPAKIIVTQDYVMKGGTLIPKQPGGQVITISNVSPAPVVSNHASPKKQVQYIKLLNNVGSTNMPTITTTKGKIAAVTANAAVSKIDKDTPVIVASSTMSGGTLNIKGTNSVQSSKSGIAVVPVASSAVKTTPGQRLILPAVSKAKIENSQSVLNETKQLKTSSNIVVVPNDVLEKFKGEFSSNSIKPKDDIKTKDHSKVNHESQENVSNVSDLRAATKSPTKHITPTPAEPGNGLRSRKPCNCTRSQCLKLYCECFANGEFCNNCNCVSCHNNMSHEENRQHAIRSCLDRNPQAFRPKIGKCLVGLSDRRHTKGCHCKRSGCLKNYCECYEAQIPCSENCKCMGCKNIDEMLFATTYPATSNSLEKPDSELEFQTFSKNKLTAEINDAVGQSGSSNPRYYNRKARTNPRHAFSFIKDQVVEATCQCLLAQADEVKRRNINVEDGQKYILEEFGRCLIQIIECAPNKYAQS